MFFSIICMIINFYIGPVASPFRPAPDSVLIKSCRNIGFFILRSNVINIYLLRKSNRIISEKYKRIIMKNFNSMKCNVKIIINAKKENSKSQFIFFASSLYRSSACSFASKYLPAISFPTDCIIF